MKNLWDDISLIYEGLYFRKRMLMDNLMIISKDNYYLLHYSPSGQTTTQIRIEKNYNLVRMWGGDVPYDITNYKLHVENGGKIELDENHKIELTYKIITPLLREVKLLQLEI